ncbi:unnamed protein product [Auanema sp. JU1783]|nr:unnamed protein product [Auanema sp. JU1783]
MRFILCILVLCSELSFGDTFKTILHLADFHMDVDYSVNGEKSQMCHNVGNQSKTNKLGSYGDYMCDSPEALVAYTLKQARSYVQSPDLVLWTGDNVPHIQGYSWDYVYRCIDKTTSLIKNEFYGINIIPTFGNHDYAPANAYDTYSDLYSRTFNLWQNYIPADQKENFLRGGYYRRHIEGAVFLVLNTNLYYNVNEAYANFTNPDDPAEMFAFMESELERATKCPNQINGGTCYSIVHIVAHIPPGAFERTPYYNWFRPQYNERFLNITVKYASTIKWMLYGHHHTDTFHIIRDESNKPVQMSLMAPAVTPWFSDLRGAGANNPAFRIYRASDDYTKILDIETYYVNLTQLNNDQNGLVNFEFEYSFKAAYGLSSEINATTMDEVVQKMKTDSETLQTYLKYNSVQWNVTTPTGDLLNAQLCALEFSDYPRYEQCMRKGKSNNFVPQIFIFIIFLFYLL